MSSRSDRSWTSEASTQVTRLQDADSRTLFKAVVADISFDRSSDHASVTIKKDRTVYDVINDGPATIMESKDAELRWIHLPANNMTWVEELMERLHMEQPDQNADQEGGTLTITKFNKVLREDLWRNAFHGRFSESIHSRFMMPTATRYSSIDPDGLESDECESTWSHANVTVLFMPYIHWETYDSWKKRQIRIKKLKELKSDGKQCDCLDDMEHPSGNEINRNEALLHQYLHNKKAPIHDRRTLDQSYFYNLRNVDRVDKDQIIGQYTWNKAVKQDPERKMMMTDQLWMWVIDGKYIITSFPQTGTTGDKEADVLHRILDNLPRSIQQGTTRSVNGLIALIIDYCTGVFHRSDINPDLAFFEFFADEIGAAKSDVEQMFRQFSETSQAVEKLWSDPTISTKRISQELDRIFSIEHEVHAMEEADKIISDLDKIDFLCSQQENVIQGLLKCCRSGRNNSMSRSIAEIYDIVKDRRKAWQGMAHTAKVTHKSLHGLLDLKQRQATVSEARTVRHQVEISAKQGQSIMILTVFTVFFLPISVVGTIFGMNAAELQDGGKIHVKTIGKVIVPTTVTLIMLAFVLAFNQQFMKMAKICTDLVYGRIMGTGQPLVLRRDMRV